MILEVQGDIFVTTSGGETEDRRFVGANHASSSNISNILTHSLQSSASIPE